MYITILRRLGFFGAYLLFMFIWTPVGFAADETKIDSVKTFVEQFESGRAHNFSLDQLTDNIRQARKELDAHIESHQNDIEALIISVRLSIIEKLVTPTMISKGKEPSDPNELFVPQHLNLDQALKLQPDNAEAHYWKARLYGIRPPTISASGRLEKKNIDLDKAIHFARKAVQLDPQNVRYREALALYLIDGQHRKEALEVMNTRATKRNPIYILLKDIDAFPVLDRRIPSIGRHDFL